MFLPLLLVLSQTAAATPVPTPPVAPPPPVKLGGGFGAPRRVAPAAGKTRVVVTDRNLAPTGTGKGAFSVAGPPVGGEPSLDLAMSQINEAEKAQLRQEKAIDMGIWTVQNIHYNAAIRDEARRDWDAAVEACRKTPGCKPVYRPKDILPTGDETLEKLRQSPFKR